MVFKASGSSQSLESGNSLPREDTPLLGSPQNGLSSQPKTFANVFNAIVGAGVLGLPYVFKRTGWLTGILMLFTVSALMTYCMMLLVYTRRKLESLKGSMHVYNAYGDLGFAVCGRFGKFLVDVLLLLSQMGFCVGYLIFIGNTLGNVFNYDTVREDILGMAYRTFYILGCFPVQLGLNSIPTLTHLAPLSIFADVVDIGAMGIVMVEDVLIFAKKEIVVESFGTVSALIYGIGAAVYMFEGVGMVLPIDSEAKNKGSFWKILTLSMFLITLTYGGFGLLSYFAFGHETKDIITANLGRGWVSVVVQLGLAINLFLTFPLTMNPVYEVVERRFCDGRYNVWLRWLLVLVVALVAILVPNFSDFLSLVGSSVCCLLGFILPALFHMVSHRDEIGWLSWSMDVGIVVLGVIVGILGTWSALEEIFTVKA